MRPLRKKKYFLLNKKKFCRPLSSRAREGGGLGGLNGATIKKGHFLGLPFKFNSLWHPTQLVHCFKILQVHFINLRKHHQMAFLLMK